MKLWAAAGSFSSGELKIIFPTTGKSFLFLNIDLLNICLSTSAKNTEPIRIVGVYQGKIFRIKNVSWVKPQIKTMYFFKKKLVLFVENFTMTLQGCAGGVLLLFIFIYSKHAVRSHKI